jgi:AcrR family transcriptional regulator
MAAPSTDRMTAEDRREAIVEAAAPLFAAKGFDAVTTREVAEAAGVSEALLYRHFDNKAALYEAIQDTCIVRATADAARIEALPDSTGTLVLAAYLIMSNIQLGSLPGHPNENIPRLILRSLLTDGHFARGFVGSTSAKWIAKIERCIRAGIEAGEVEETFEHALGCAWFSHHIACAMVFYRLPGDFVVSYPGGNDPERLLELSMKFALRGLGLTAKAIATYYQPQAFALLRSAPHAD